MFRKCVKAYAASLPLHLLDQVLQGQHPQQSASILESIEAASRYRADLVRPLLEEQWRALCLGEFLGKDQLLLKEGQNTSWKHLYQVGKTASFKPINNFSFLRSVVIQRKIGFDGSAIV